MDSGGGCRVRLVEALASIRSVWAWLRPRALFQESSEESAMTPEMPQSASLSALRLASFRSETNASAPVSDQAVAVGSDAVTALP